MKLFILALVFCLNTLALACDLDFGNDRIVQVNKTNTCIRIADVNPSGYPFMDGVKNCESKTNVMLFFNSEECQGNGYANGGSYMEQYLGQTISSWGHEVGSLMLYEFESQ